MPGCIEPCRKRNEPETFDPTNNLICFSVTFKTWGTHVSKETGAEAWHSEVFKFINRFFKMWDPHVMKCNDRFNSFVLEPHQQIHSRTTRFLVLRHEIPCVKLDFLEPLATCYIHCGSNFSSNPLFVRSSFVGFTGVSESTCVATNQVDWPFLTPIEL